jgi:diazepam-binding inhibitor (GABA receptor modulator, acyl-CoA-binding protein)
MTLEERFEDAQQRVNKLSSAPSQDKMLELYGLYKQAKAGDVTGKRPGMLDLKGRAKYDAWEARKGMTKDRAMEAYVALVDSLGANAAPAASRGA